MQIIARKSNLYNNQEFIKEILQEIDAVQGIMLDVVMTKDKQVLVFSPVMSNQTTINTIQNSNLEEISYLDVFFLEDALKMNISGEQKFILNLLPLNEVVLIQNIQKITEENNTYARVVSDIISKYPSLNIFLCSSSYNLLYAMKKNIANRKLGVVLDINNSSYIDVDFYIFSIEMFDQNIFEEQLSLGKEVMLLLDSGDEMTRFLFYVRDQEVPLELLWQIQYISSYPALLYTLFENDYFKKG